MGSIGWPELVIILMVALLLFGGTRLAGLGKASGKAIREFKEETRDLRTQDVGKLDQSNASQNPQVVDQGQAQPSGIQQPTQQVQPVQQVQPTQQVQPVQQVQPTQPPVNASGLSQHPTSAQSGYIPAEPIDDPQNAQSIYDSQNETQQPPAAQ